MPLPAKSVAEGLELFIIVTYTSPNQPDARHTTTIHMGAPCIFFSVRRCAWSGLNHRLTTSTREFAYPWSLEGVTGFNAAYVLQAVVVHVGTALKGHYTAYVRNQNTWDYCNDGVVVLSTRAEALSQTRSVYLLLYTNIAYLEQQ